MRTTSATGSSAFTLIELSIVIFIMAMLVALSAPALVRSFNSAALGEAARAFATTCQLARLQAVTRQVNAVLHVDADRQTFWLTQTLATPRGSGARSDAQNLSAVAAGDAGLGRTGGRTDAIIREICGSAVLSEWHVRCLDGGVPRQ